MNLFIKILIFLNLVIISDLIAQDCKTHVVINCDIVNVNIYVDDILQANNGQTEIDLSKGIHKIVASENSDRWDAKTFIDSLRIVNCDTINLTYNFKQEVLLNSNPQDAYVFSNDSLLGYTPLLIPAGLSNLKLEKKGFESIFVKYKDFENEKPIKLNYSGEAEDGQFFDKPLFKILAGGMVLLGATTAYFKLKADNNFDEYKKTHDKDLLDQTDKFDTISGITFAAFQINFGALIYFFLVD